MAKEPRSLYNPSRGGYAWKRIQNDDANAFPRPGAAPAPDAEYVYLCRLKKDIETSEMYAATLLANRKMQSPVHLDSTIDRQTKSKETTAVDRNSQHVDSHVAYEHLGDLERMLQEINADVGEGLDLDAFKEAMKRIVGNVDDEELDIIFKKVDTECHGSVTLEKYLNYVLTEYQGKASMYKPAKLLSFLKPMKVVPVAHREIIVKVVFFPNINRGIGKRGVQERIVEKDTSTGRFLTISKDGVLIYWSESFKLLRTVQFSKIFFTAKQTFSTGSILHVHIAKLWPPNLDFYDISSSKCDRSFSLVDLSYCTASLDYWTDGQKAVFSVGDARGNILIFASSDAVHHGLFNLESFMIRPGHVTQIPVQALLNRPTNVHQTIRVLAVHGDWCTQIKFIPELNCVASCSAAERTAMVLTTLSTKRLEKTTSSRIVVRKGILCFDYCPEMNILLTGGIDPSIRVWNPFVTTSPVAVMKGHMACVTHLLANGKEHIIISVSKDKNIRIWDIRDHMCLQSILARNIPLGRSPVSAVYYSNSKNMLICTTYEIGVLRASSEAMEFSGKILTSHSEPLCAALFNSNFNQVVSGCHSGVVSVWDIMTGQKVMQFSTSKEKSVEVTAMTFDGPGRRLITGLKDGTIKLWNFNNGTCLQELPHFDKKEITGLLYNNHRIYVCGWSKRVTWYLDTKDGNEIDYKQWKPYHKDDIFSGDVYQNKLLATASYSGDIVIWKLDTTQAICRFNASQSPHTLEPKRVTGPPDRCEGFEMDNKASCGAVCSTKHKCDLLEELKKPHAAVEKVLFLRTRKQSTGTAVLLTSSADGYIYAWSVSSPAGMLGKFRVAPGNDNTDPSVSTMCTDMNNQILLTTDSRGFIKIWDIENYCRHKGEGSEVKGKNGKASTSEGLPLRFSVPHYCRPIALKHMPLGPETEVLDGLIINLRPPGLLSSWRGHLKNISHVEYVDKHKLIVTASYDCNIRLWRLSGSCLGTFGLSSWQVGLPTEKPYDVPRDLRRIGSSQTLRVLNEGRYPHWELAQDIFAAYHREKKRRTMLASFMQSKTDMSSYASKRLRKMLQKGPQIFKLTDEPVESTWQKWEFKGMEKSTILGSSYNQKVRHRITPALPDLKASFGWREQPRIYSSINISDLQNISQPQVPEAVLETQMLQTQVDNQKKILMPGKKSLSDIFGHPVKNAWKASQTSSSCSSPAPASL
ncbi:EF-hand calcium-binding domain-containing protein 8 isoform X2 [Lissotriton helveticus]